jgi:2-hydroxy-3-oxopropionate reductase
MTESKVGFVGLGIMGKPMARNLMEAGHELVVFNRSREPADELAADGARAAGTPREVAEGSGVVITMLPDSPQVREVVCGEDGVLAGAGEGTLVIDMSTISPLVTRELAEAGDERGVGMLDAPVSGGEPGAISGELSIMVGGSSEDFARAEPLFQAMGSAIHVGPAGTGQVVKACNQIVVALTIEAVSEALVLGSKAGVDPAKVIEALSGGLAGSKVMEAKASSFLEHDFDPGFRVELHHKDLGIALAAAREYGVPLPVTALVDQMLQNLQVAGRGDRDHSALLTVLEEAAQHRIGEPPKEAAGD